MLDINVCEVVGPRLKFTSGLDTEAHVVHTGSERGEFFGRGGAMFREAEVGAAGQCEESALQIYSIEFPRRRKPEDTLIERSAGIKVADSEREVVNSGEVGHSFGQLPLWRLSAIWPDEAVGIAEHEHELISILSDREP